MSNFIQSLWQFNIEFSLLLAVILFARYAVRRTTRNYNAYLLWMSIPAGLLVAALLAQVDVAQAPVQLVGYAVNSYVVQPAMVVEHTDVSSVFGRLWLLVTALLLLRLTVQHRQLRWDLRQITSPKRLNLQAAYPVVAIEKADFSPAVYGFLRPTIYFPVHLLQELSTQQVNLIMRHEEHHIRQQHLWLNLAWDIAVCVMWFNPLLYISRQSFRHDQELFCDYLVLNKSGRQNKNSYGHALLSTVSATHSVSLLCSWKTFNQLEERIMNIKKPASFASKVLLSLCGIVIVTATSLYAASAGESDDQETKHKQVVKIVHKGDGAHAGSHKKIKIVKDGVTFVEEDGQRYVLDGDDKRAMTEAELEQFEQEIEQAKQHIEDSGISSEGRQHKEIRIMRGHGAGELSDEDMKRIIEELQGAELDLELHQDDFARAERDIERAEKELEAAHAKDQLSATALANARSQIAAARESLAQEQERMRASLERARQDLERMRADLLKSE